MRFVLNSFETGADVKFEIPDADLNRHPDTMLSAFAGPAGTPDSRPEVQLKAVKAAETYWSDDMEVFLKTYYARASGDQQLRLVGAVTLATLYEAFLTELAPARFRSFVEGGLTVCWGPDGHELCTRDGKKYDFEKHDLRLSSSVLSGWESE